MMAERKVCVSLIAIGFCGMASAVFFLVPQPIIKFGTPGAVQEIEIKYVDHSVIGMSRAKLPTHFEGPSTTIVQPLSPHIGKTSGRCFSMFK